MQYIAVQDYIPFNYQEKPNSQKCSCYRHKVAETEERVKCQTGSITLHRCSPNSQAQISTVEQDIFAT